jgi:hypothetical protein
MRGNYPHEQAPEQERGRVLNIKCTKLKPRREQGRTPGRLLATWSKRAERSGRRAVSM